MEKSQLAVLLRGASKIDGILHYTFCRSEQIHIIITDTPLPAKIFFETDRLGIRVIKIHGKEEPKCDMPDLSIDFLLYGALAQICTRTTGFSRAVFSQITPLAPIALGTALYIREPNHKKSTPYSDRRHVPLRKTSRKKRNSRVCIP